MLYWNGGKKQLLSCQLKMISKVDASMSKHFNNMPHATSKNFKYKKPVNVYTSCYI